MSTGNSAHGDDGKGDEDKMGPTRVRDLLIIAGVVAIAVWIPVSYTHLTLPTSDLV